MQGATAGILDELSPENQNRVKNGELVEVYKTSREPQAPWPVCYVYKRIDATPKEAAAAFSDYELQLSYIPNATLVKISKVYSKVEKDVDYQLNLPMGIGKEVYTARDLLSGDLKQNQFKVSWTIYPTNSIKLANGEARFEEMGTGTILAYRNFIFPTRFGAGLGWVVEKAKKQVSESVVAIAKQVEHEKVNQAELLEKQVQALEEALSE